MKHTTSFVVQAPIDAVADAICSEAYNVDEGNARKEVISTTFAVVDEQPGRKQYEVRFVEHGRTKFGKIDKTKTADAVVKSTWDDSRHMLTWRYEGQEGPRVSISGVTRLEEQGDQTRVIYETDIEVRIPVIGNKVAQIIAREFGAAIEGIQPILERHAATSSYARD